MKKSEMAERMRKHFNTEHCDQVALLAYQIIDFLEQQGMQPPKRIKYAPTAYAEPNKRIVYEWEDEE